MMAPRAWTCQLRPGTCSLLTPASAPCCTQRGPSHQSRPARVRHGAAKPADASGAHLSPTSTSFPGRSAVKRPDGQQTSGGQGHREAARVPPHRGQRCQGHSRPPQPGTRTPETKQSTLPLPRPGEGHTPREPPSTEPTARVRLPPDTCRDRDKVQRRQRGTRDSQRLPGAADKEPAAPGREVAAAPREGVSVHPCAQWAPDPSSAPQKVRARCRAAVAPSQAKGHPAMSCLHLPPRQRHQAGNPATSRCRTEASHPKTLVLGQGPAAAAAASRSLRAGRFPGVSAGRVRPATTGPRSPLEGRDPHRVTTSQCQPGVPASVPSASAPGSPSAAGGAAHPGQPPGPPAQGSRRDRD